MDRFEACYPESGPRRMDNDRAAPRGSYVSRTTPAMTMPSDRRVRPRVAEPGPPPPPPPFSLRDRMTASGLDGALGFLTLDDERRVSAVDRRHRDKACLPRGDVYRARRTGPNSDGPCPPHIFGARGSDDRACCEESDHVYMHNLATCYALVRSGREDALEGDMQRVLAFLSKRFTEDVYALPSTNNLVSYLILTMSRMALYPRLYLKHSGADNRDEFLIRMLLRGSAPISSRDVDIGIGIDSSWTPGRDRRGRTLWDVLHHDGGVTVTLCSKRSFTLDPAMVLHIERLRVVDLAAESWRRPMLPSSVDVGGVAVAMESEGFAENIKREGESGTEPVFLAGLRRWQCHVHVKEVVAPLHTAERWLRTLVRGMATARRDGIYNFTSSYIRFLDGLVDKGTVRRICLDAFTAMARPGSVEIVGTLEFGGLRITTLRGAIAGAAADVYARPDPRVEFDVKTESTTFSLEMRGSE